ncbi:MAG: Pyrrolidone-carboxylate peptidase [Planctomycetota bacterium]|jgi:pyroglutamyl-peptidase
MPSVLVTAFEPYDRWEANSSWLTLVELTRNMPSEPRLVTRRYPVDFLQAQKRLEKDLEGDFDFVLHLGQAPGSGNIRLEAIALNLGSSLKDDPERPNVLVLDGPLAYRSPLPLSVWADQLRKAGIPARVSFHAGTYLCNALLYYSLHLAQQRGLRTQAAFIHLPLDPSQIAGDRTESPALPASVSATALRHILADLSRRV